MKLYTYFRSSSAYRVRIGLNLKGLDIEHVSVGLKDAAARAEHLRINPEGKVPLLEDGGFVLTQSLAILEYLDELHPDPPLLPADPRGRARARQLALLIAADIQPLQNLGVQMYVAGKLGQGNEGSVAWARHWIETGLGAFEKHLRNDPPTGPYCVSGDRPTIADICLVPQLFNAARYGCDASVYPTAAIIGERCKALRAFAAAAPEAQPDAV